MSAEWLFTFKHFKFPLFPLLTHSALLKKHILEQIYVAVFTAHQVQFYEVFAIFINLDIPRVSRKLLKICLETTADLCIFFTVTV